MKTLGTTFDLAAPMVDFKTGHWVAQTKFNGVNCEARRDGLWTRNGNRIVSVPHIENALREFFTRSPHAVLRGELFCDALRDRLNDLVSIISRSAPTAADLECSRRLVRFHVFNGFFPDVGLNRSTPYELRKVWIDTMVAGHVMFCELVPSVQLASRAHLDAVYAAARARGDEGVMVVNTMGSYETEPIKMKPRQSDEFAVVDVLDGTVPGRAKVMVLRMANGHQFRATVCGDPVSVESLLPLIGQPVTAEFSGYTGLKTPQNALFYARNCSPFGKPTRVESCDAETRTVEACEYLEALGMRIL